MKPFVSAVLLGGAVLTSALITGCTGGTAASKPAAPSSRAAEEPAATVPGGCPVGSSLPLPEDFPATLPVPEGTQVIAVEHRTGGRLVVSTVVRGGFKAALSFMRQRLPKAGYTLTDGEVEEDDAESYFSSATVKGRWTLRTVPGCPGGVYLTYLTSSK
jgi:hypothetical protein